MKSSAIFTVAVYVNVHHIYDLNYQINLTIYFELQKMAKKYLWLSLGIFMISFLL